MKKVLSIFSRLFSTFLFCLIFSLSTVYVTVTGLKLAADPYFLIPAALIFSTSSGIVTDSSAIS